MILRKTPAGKDFRIYGSLKDGKRVLAVMERCFKRHELPISFELRQDRVHEIPSLDGQAKSYYRPHNKKTVIVELILNTKDDITIAHELVHSVLYCKYGHTDPRCHDEESVEREAMRRIKNR